MTASWLSHLLNQCVSICWLTQFFLKLSSVFKPSSTKRSQHRTLIFARNEKKHNRINNKKMNPPPNHLKKNKAPGKLLMMTPVPRQYTIFTFRLPFTSEMSPSRSSSSSQGSSCQQELDFPAPSARLAQPCSLEQRRSIRLQLKAPKLQADLQRQSSTLHLSAGWVLHTDTKISECGSGY